MALLRFIANPGKAAARVRRRRKLRSLFGATGMPSLHRQVIRKIDQPMILISQVQRSGGTLMGRLFDGHPECFTYPGELAVGGNDKSVWPDLAATPNAGAAFELMTRRSLNWVATAVSEGYRKDGVATMHSPLPFVFNTSEFKPIFEGSVANNRNPSPRDFLDAYHTAFFNCWIDNQDFYLQSKKFVVAFTPRINLQHENHDRFWACYPDGHWITLVRSPAAWYASASRHSTAYTNPEEALAIWRRSTESSLQLKRRYPERVILLRFEDLVTQTEACMREICERTGMEWSSRLLLPSFNTMPTESNSSFNAESGIDAAAATRQTEALSTPEMHDHIGELEELLRDAEGDFDLR